MPHDFNQRVFASLDTTSPLLHSYLKLVGIELALKNHDQSNWSQGHHIEVMISALGKPALVALAQTLRTVLASLWCEKKGGGAVNVTASNFPTIRYLRHDSDFAGSSDVSSDADLIRLRDAVDDLATELKKEGLLS